MARLAHDRGHHASGAADRAPGAEVINVGAGEVLVVLLVALLVLGPERLPAAARQVGRAVTHLRDLGGGAERELRQAMQPSATPSSPHLQGDQRATSGDPPSPGDVPTHT